ncbi:hypothetical protein DMB65_04820 [Flavobacterium cheongpyeongense]|uniref:DUF1843 domain-containing protein n=1 Tax=Flavobacterium cheongpyeongense TaxID=2212651 RepID=A0A2V4BS49_9FLAO|nr:DUF1843 domain-containing protein [Flavobacterium cheongpyeongense]PXY41889.1 hypothetical protein DMB65_04820 [Flavobacterium cheongpyeongense]
MGVMPMYGVAIREAIASNDLAKMEAVAEQAKQTVKEQGDISAALFELLDAIDSLKGKK